MKKFTTSLFIIICSITACNNSADDQTSGDGDTSVSTVPTPAAAGSLAGCYRMILNERDTVSLQLSAEGEQLTGPLYYHWYEKDRSDGVFSGTSQDERIVGWYTFQSEGMTSVQQLIWQVDGDKLYSGTGDIDQRGDSIVFKDPGSVNFDTTNFLSRIDCEDAVSR